MHKKSFHRTKKESKVLGYIGLTFVGILALLFLLVGFSGIEERGFDSFRLIFGMFGIALFILFFRGAWIASGGARTHVLSIDEEGIEWGIVGKEKSVTFSELREVYWDESDGFDLTLIRHSGKRERVLNIETVVSAKGRGSLLACLKSAHPETPLTGHIETSLES